MIGLSSAESEYYALTKGACTALGLQSHLADWNLPAELVLHTDSSSAKAVRQEGELEEHSPYPDATTLVARKSGREAPQSAEGSHRGESSRRAYKSATRSQDEDSLRSNWSGLALRRLLRRQSRGGRSTLWLTARALAPGCHEQLRGHESATEEHLAEPPGHVQQAGAIEDGSGIGGAACLTMLPPT